MYMHIAVDLAKAQTDSGGPGVQAKNLSSHHLLGVGWSADPPRETIAQEDLASTPRA